LIDSFDFPAVVKFAISLQSSCAIILQVSWSRFQNICKTGRQRRRNGPKISNAPKINGIDERSRRAADAVVWVRVRVVHFRMGLRVHPRDNFIILHACKCILM
jgi:hypothetical protein